MKPDDFKYIPSKKLHVSRNNYNIVPTGTLKFKGEFDKYDQKVYIDEIGRKFHELKWYHSIFHNPVKNIKLQYYHCDLPIEIINQYPYPDTGSSEIIVQKNYIKIIENNELHIHSSHIQRSVL